MLATAGPVLLLLLVGAVFAYRRATEVNHARNELLPRIASLADEGRFCAAFALASRIEPVLGEDQRLTDLRGEVSRSLNLDTEPTGADVFYSDLRSSDHEWLFLGKAPLRAVRVPRGYVRLRFDKQGFESINAVLGAVTQDAKFPLYPKAPIPAGMVPVPQVVFDLPRRFSPPTRTATDEPFRFLIDRYEVTNRQFREFVDAGGYREKKFWKHPFVQRDKPLSWEEGMAAFADSTGRPGPSTWEAGTSSPGHEDYPVTGVSWYEAAAYAEYSGKQLPTVWHWYAAARLNTGTWVLPSSNFSAKGLARVGEYRGEGPFGTYDMAGNAKEWCWNEAQDGKRMILGGAWSEMSHTFLVADSKSPFDRSALHGFRCARYLSPLQPSWFSPVYPTLRSVNDKPASDELFGAYRSAYAYDRVELSPSVDRTDDSQPYWRVERISYSAPYGGGRVAALLILPKNSKPPYPTVVYYPGAGAQSSLSSVGAATSLEGWARLEYLLRAGRAVLYPVYQGTYERRLSRVLTPLQRREMIVEQVKHLRRGIDYLQSRPDISTYRLALFGVSAGAALAPIPLAVEDRLKAAVLADGGLYMLPSLAEVDPLHFAPRVHIPWSCSMARMTTSTR